MSTGRVPTTANSPLTAKGDLFTYSTTQARLAVGNDGDTLVADSAATTGLRWQGNFAAGKNKIINADFSIWQRGTSFNYTVTSVAYTADRWMIQCNLSSGTSTVSQQTFTPGTAPVAGYESPFFLRVTNSSGATNVEFQQRVEDVRTFAGQTVKLSFWAKASSTVAMANVIYQNFGTGGSALVTVNSSEGWQTLTSSWARYTLTFTMPSISGKTIGTNSHLQIFPMYYGSGTIASNVIDIWGVQLEAGSVATAFQTATGTIQGELAACQRYYTRWTTTDVYSTFGYGNAYSTTASQITCFNPVSMRVEPTSVDFSNIAHFDGANVIAATSCILYNSGNQALTVTLGATGLTQWRPYALISNNSTSGYIGFSAEL